MSKVGFGDGRLAAMVSMICAAILLSSKFQYLFLTASQEIVLDAPSQSNFQKGPSLPEVKTVEVASPVDKQVLPKTFSPGTLKHMTKTETFERCHVDKEALEKSYAFFPNDNKIYWTLSEKYRLLYIIMLKAGSSSQRNILKNYFNATDFARTAQEWEDYTSFTFVREPTSRFKAAYLEAWIRTAPWAQPDLSHPYPYLYSEAKTKQEYNQKTNTTTTMENFEKFLQEYDRRAFDRHLIPMVHLVQQRTKSRAVTHIFSLEDYEAGWNTLSSKTSVNIPAEGFVKLYSKPKFLGLDLELLSPEGWKKVCELSLWDSCCFNYELPPQCQDSGLVCETITDEATGESRIRPSSR